jgi:hypothetical protein
MSLMLSVMVAVVVPTRPVQDPLAMVKLQPNELCRVVRFGGRTASGVFHSTWIVRTDRTVNFSTASVPPINRTLTGAEWTAFSGALGKLNPKAMKARKASMPMAASCGTDTYVSARLPSGVFQWSTAQFQMPNSVPLFDLLAKWTPEGGQ